MTKWKKSVSALLSAALLASLLGTVAAPAVLAADNSSVLDCTVALDTTVCSQVADGASTVTLAGAPVDTDSGTVGIQQPANGFKLVVTLDNNTFLSEVGGWILASDNKSATFAFDGTNNLSASDTLTIKAPSAAGTTTATAVLQSAPHPTTGIVTTTSFGNVGITWVASANLNVSEANSVVKIVGPGATCALSGSTFTETAVASAPASPTLTNVATLCVLVKTAAGTVVSSGSVSATISPVGLLGAGSQVASATISGTGVASIPILSSGVAGVASITISVTSNGVTTTFAPKTFTFTGSLAKFELTNVRYAFLRGAAIPANTVIAQIKATDAAGNELACNTAWVAKETGTALLGGALSVSASFDVDGDGTNDCTVIHAGGTPATAGSTTVVVQNAASGPTVVSNAVTFNVVTAPTTMTVTFDKSVVAPGGLAKALVTLKDSAGRPAADGISINAFANSGLVISSAGTNTATTKNGIATFTYIAPNTSGVATVTAFDTVNSLTASGSITVGAVATAGAASALGVTTTGPFSTTTKVQAVRRYVTFRFELGAAAAGKTVTILGATKSSSGVWSSFTTLTSRVANSSGTVYYYSRQNSATWKSFRATSSDTGVITPARQARWR